MHRIFVNVTEFLEDVPATSRDAASLTAHPAHTAVSTLSLSLHCHSYPSLAPHNTCARKISFSRSFCLFFVVSRTPGSTGRAFPLPYSPAAVVTLTKPVSRVNQAYTLLHSFQRPAIQPGLIRRPSGLPILEIAAMSLGESSNSSDARFDIAFSRFVVIGMATTSC